MEKIKTLTLRIIPNYKFDDDVKKRPPLPKTPTNKSTKDERKESILDLEKEFEQELEQELENALKKELENELKREFEKEFDKEFDKEFEKDHKTPKKLIIEDENLKLLTNLFHINSKDISRQEYEKIKDPFDILLCSIKSHSNNILCGTVSITWINRLEVNRFCEHGKQYLHNNLDILPSFKLTNVHFRYYNILIAFIECYRAYKKLSTIFILHDEDRNSDTFILRK